MQKYTAHHGHKVKLKPSSARYRDDLTKEVCTNCWVPLSQGSFLWSCTECNFFLCTDCAAAEPDRGSATPVKSLLPMGLGRSSKAEDLKPASKYTKAALKKEKKSGIQSAAALPPSIASTTASLVDAIELSASASLSSSKPRRRTMRELEKLDLTHWSISDDILAVICYHCPNLTSLTIKNCVSLTDACLASIISLTRLQELNISQCHFLNGGRIAATVAQLKNLQKLDLTNCKTLTDAILVIIGDCNQLQGLSLDGCTGISFIGIQGLLFRLHHIRVLKLGNLKIPPQKIWGLRHTLPEIEITYTIPHTELNHYRKQKSMGVKDIVITPFGNLGKKRDLVVAFTSAS